MSPKTQRISLRGQLYKTKEPYLRIQLLSFLLVVPDYFVQVGEFREEMPEVGFGG